MGGIAMDWVEIIVCIISGVFTLVGVLFSNTKHYNEMNAKLDKSLAVTDTKLENLTREVREYSLYTQKVPVLEEKVRTLEERLYKLESK